MAFTVQLSSLRARLLILVALAVLPGVVVAFSTAELWREHETADARADALRLAGHASTLHARMLDDSRGALFTLAQLISSFADDTGHIQWLLDACLREHRGYESLTLFRPDGTVAVRVGLPTRASAPPHDRPYVTRALNAQGFAVGDYEVDTSAGRVSLPFAYPVLGPHGQQARGVLAATVGTRWLSELATKALLPRGTTIVVFDDQGVVYVGEPTAGEQARVGSVPPNLLRAVLAGTGPHTGEVTTSDGVSRQYGVEPLLGVSQNRRLYIMIGIPTAVATAGAGQILLRNLLLIGFALLLAGTVAWVGSDVFVLRQTRALVAATGRLAAGDLTARTGVARSGGELHELAHAFDEMASVLERDAEQISLQREALNRQAARFKALIERSSDGIFLADERGVLKYVSPSTTRILGHQPSELAGADGFDLVHPDDREFARATFRAALSRPAEHVTSVVRMRDRNGEWRWIESTLTNLLSEGSVEAVISNYRDVTESRDAAHALMLAQEQLETRVEERTAELSRANAALQAEIAERRRAWEVLRKYSRAIEQAGDSVFITDRAGTIEYVNSAFERLTGYSVKEAVGATPRIFSSGAHDAGFYRSVWQTLLSGQVFRAVFLNKAKDGRRYYEDQTITPLHDDTGQLTHFVSTGRDITQRKRTEEALRRLNERLEQEATRIAAALHDEAAQFLTAAHITLADVGRDLPPDARNRLDSVRGHLNEIEEQLRRLAHELRPRILDDFGLVEALRFLAEGMSRRSGFPVTVSASLQRRCPPLVETAVYRMVQEALTNMLKHARATSCTVALREEGGALHCSVHDNGRGFDVAAVRSHPGDTSLGLIGIQDRLEALGGTFEIISSPAGGTELRAKISLEG